MNNIVLNGFDKDVAFNYINNKNTNPAEISTDVNKVLCWNQNMTTIGNQASTIKFYDKEKRKNYKVTICFG